MTTRLSIAAVLLLSLIAAVVASESVKERSLVRQKRQFSLALYLCGSFPNQFTSYFPCGPCYMNCVTSTFSYQALSPLVYSYGYPSIMGGYGGFGSGFFPGATQAQRCIGPCVNGQCPDGYACNANNVCCAI
nr:unnamed protein product [Haemonchus contortus]